MTHDATQARGTPSDRPSHDLPRLTYAQDGEPPEEHVAPRLTEQTIAGQRVNALAVPVISEIALRALLGEPRAEMLRRLDHPMAVGRLAESMLYVPSAITYHLLILERAGLVERIRAGRNIHVHRTPRADALLDLYRDWASPEIVEGC
jgi:DNA-binding transcriptional ArsR family regulator